MFFSLQNKNMESRAARGFMTRRCIGKALFLLFIFVWVRKKLVALFFHILFFFLWNGTFAHDG